MLSDSQKSAFGKRVKELREGKDLTQQQLAVQLGIANKQTISSYEHGTLPCIEYVCELAEFFGVSLDYLIYGKDTPVQTSGLTYVDNVSKLSHSILDLGLSIDGPYPDNQNEEEKFFTINIYEHKDDCYDMVQQLKSIMDANLNNVLPPEEYHYILDRLLALYAEAYSFRQTIGTAPDD